jgi:hypothetical protein
MINRLNQLSCDCVKLRNICFSGYVLASPPPTLQMLLSNFKQRVNIITSLLLGRWITARWEENIQLKINFLHHSWHSPVFTWDHLEMWHQFKVIRKGQWKAKTFSRTHYNTSPRGSCQCQCISNTAHKSQRNGFMKWGQETLGESHVTETDLLVVLSCTPYIFSLL